MAPNVARHVPILNRLGPAVIQATLAVAALITGVLVYYLDRDPGTAYFLSKLPFTAQGTDLFFGELGKQLPEFLHVFALILLTSAVLSPDQRGLLAISAFWFCIECFFEIGQHTVLAPHLAALIPSWFQEVPILERTADFFLLGTFDILDVLAIAAGTIVGYFTSSTISKWRISNG